MSVYSVSHQRDPMRMRESFRISGYVFEGMPAVIATVGNGRFEGRGEGAGVYYLDDDAANIEQEIDGCRSVVEAGIDRAALQTLLPPGGARNALDCALWELESLTARTPVWKLAGMKVPRPLITTFTLPADDPAEILTRLASFPTVRAIKLKLDGELAADAERVRVVREARPDVWIGVDANQGFSSDDLDGLTAMLVDYRVSLLEQPIRRGAESALDGWRSPIPVAADESIQDLSELEEQHSRFQIVNIKLDKSGGLTEALKMAEVARSMGMGVMVGNMCGSTLATAPAFVLGQVCDVVDLDGAWFLADDPFASRIYHDGKIMVPSELWGAS